MPEYWGDPEKTASTIDNANWLHSGDIAVLDDDGYCQIVGRLKDMLIRGGENIFPREIEEFLFQHPKIEQAEVIGVPDRKYGEEICAWIKLRDGESATEDEILSFCRERIAHFKIPRYILFVDEFPMTITGKVQKFKMREMSIERLALESPA
jgi:fatty-acyl-CoA synthase